MIGCYARAATTDIVIDGNELSDAQWFPREIVRQALEKKGTPELRLPPSLAIAHQLVKSWIEEG
jgi:NAD+ diphosphatase